MQLSDGMVMVVVFIMGGRRVCVNPTDRERVHIVVNVRILVRLQEVKHV